MVYSLFRWLLQQRPTFSQVMFRCLFDRLVGRKNYRLTAGRSSNKRGSTELGKNYAANSCRNILLYSFCSVIFFLLFFFPDNNFCCLLRSIVFILSSLFSFFYSFVAHSSPAFCCFCTFNCFLNVLQSSLYLVYSLMNPLWSLVRLIRWKRNILWFWIERTCSFFWVNNLRFLLLPRRVLINFCKLTG